MRIASDPERAFSTAEIAQEFNISRHHLTKAIAALAGAGYVQTRRGGGGGAVLARPACDIRIGDVVRTLERGQALVECLAQNGGACVITSNCRLKGFLSQAQNAFLTNLDQYTLADCALNKQPSVAAPALF